MNHKLQKTSKNYLFVLLLVVYQPAFILCEQVQVQSQRMLLPKLLQDPANCPINACEVLKILSQHLLHFKSSNTISNDSNKNKTNKNYADAVNRVHFEINVIERVKSVERRLRSIEQSVWKIVGTNSIDWDHCTEGSCRCLPATKSLSCWSNDLDRIPATQVIPANMLTIDLSDNKITTLHKQTFLGLTHLIELDLSKNYLDFLPGELLHDLDSLAKLRLQNNNLEDLNSKIFAKLRNLKIIDLSHNKLNTIPSTLLHPIYKITVISLCSNNLKILPNDFLKETLELEEFDISQNRLKSITAGTFDNLIKLKTLDLSENQLEFISDTAFHSLQNLDYLNIRDNRLTNISKNLLKNLHQLTILDVSINRLHRIDSYAFDSLVNLDEMYLGLNVLSTLPDCVFANQYKLKKLMLTSNSFSELKNKTFVGLVNVTTLLLNSNILRELEPAVFSPLKMLEKLRLDSNKLQHLPHGCLDQSPHLTAVKLDKNPWHCDCRVIYLARWLRTSFEKLWDGEPKCRGPGDLGGNAVGDLRYTDLCDGSWASMLKLIPRVAVRPFPIHDFKNYSEYSKNYELYENISRLIDLQQNFSMIN